MIRDHYRLAQMMEDDAIQPIQKLDHVLLQISPKLEQAGQISQI